VLPGKFPKLIIAPHTVLPTGILPEPLQ
jgi:hypothetical protein